jgi:hypothetical protein
MLRDFMFMSKESLDVQLVFVLFVRNPDFDPLENVFNFQVENKCHQLEISVTQRLHTAKCL